MLYTTLAGRVLDTDRDLDQAGRHVMQKLMAWASLGLSPREFAQKRAQALAVGWDGRGPVSEGEALRAAADDLARRVAVAAGVLPGVGWLRPKVWTGRYQGGGVEVSEISGDQLVLRVHDAADQPRGRVGLTLPRDQSPVQALEQALAELAQGQGPLSGPLRSLGLTART
ncbi:MAG: hypothetical protein LDL07_09525 [Desulfarculus sp.]|nr:hypothetical protein [Desulfarculus sp.]